MQKKLMNVSKNIPVCLNVRQAITFYSRAKGLLGYNDLLQQDALWIHRCNSIHTFFMRFSIDVVFVDRQLIVKKVLKNIPPWRYVAPVWGASSVFEMAPGGIDRGQIKKGDQLSVGD